MERYRGTETNPRLSTDTRFSGPKSRGPADVDLEVPALTLLAHRDSRRIGELISLPALSSGEEVEVSRLTPGFAPPGGAEARALGDAHLSRKPLRLIPGVHPGEIVIEQGASSTAILVDGQPLLGSRALDADAVSRGVTLEIGHHVALLLHLQPPLSLKSPRLGLIGDSGAMMRLRREIELAARLETSILLRGASGTGKELVARAVHDTSPRRDRAMVVVNMAAIPPSLAAAQLFGARKGAYTGAARDQQGYFMAAHRGTLFLDEIGETPVDVQPLLLRALECGEIQPVGSTETRRVDVRVIAATDADLDAAITDGRFRAPLLHRLAGWEIRLPTLAERRSDIGRLLAFFLERAWAEQSGSVAKEERVWPSAAIIARLTRYDWPGNVRQLINVTRRVAVLLQAGHDTAIEQTLNTLLSQVSPSEAKVPGPAPEEASTNLPLKKAPPGDQPPGTWRRAYRKARDVSEQELLAALRDNKWELKPTAEALDVSRTVLYHLIDGCSEIRTAKGLEPAEIEAALASCGGNVETAAFELRVSAQGLKLRMKSLGLR